MIGNLYKTIDDTITIVFKDGSTLVVLLDELIDFYDDNWETKYIYKYNNDDFLNSDDRISKQDFNGLINTPEFRQALKSYFTASENFFESDTMAAKFYDDIEKWHSDEDIACVLNGCCIKEATTILYNRLHWLKNNLPKEDLLRFIDDFKEEVVKQC